MKIIKNLQKKIENAKTIVQDVVTLAKCYYNLPYAVAALRKVVQQQDKIISELIYCNDIIFSTEKEQTIDVSLPTSKKTKRSR